MRIAAFVPLKLTSRRLPNKNFLRLGGHPLAHHIFRALEEVEEIEKIYCYTSQPQVLSLLPESVELLMRPQRLDGDSVKANELFRYAVETLDAEVIVLCHATSPFVEPDSIRAGIQAVLSGQHDCAFAVQRHQTYAWYDGRPLNYSPTDMAQTQDLEPVFVETSGFYIFKKSDYLERSTRIGKRPFMVEINFREAVDIDHPSDFELAKLLLEYKPDQAKDRDDDEFFVRLARRGLDIGRVAHLSFDLDGVLINSIDVMEKAWQEATKAVGSSIPFSEYKKHIGLPFTDILRNIGCRESDFETIASTYNSYASSHAADIKLYDDVVDSLNKVKKAGFKISLVTSKNRKRTHEILQLLLKDISFDAVVTPDDVASGRGKPNPDPLLMACLQVGADPGATIYVGDMEADREAASRAGCVFVHAAWGFADLAQVKDMWFSNLKDMIGFFVR